MEENKNLDINTEENNEEQYMEEKKNPIVHILLIAIIVGFIAFIAVRLYIWNKGTVDDTDVNVINHEFDVECIDYILPATPQQKEAQVDDGITTVVCFGNAPFADDYGKETNLANLIQKELGEDSVVYNCSVKGSILACANDTITSAYYYDAFSLYWLTLGFCVDNMDTLYSTADTINASDEIYETLDNIDSIDFSKVDVIAIMYDAYEYYINMRICDDDNETNVRYFTGALAASIQQIQESYPNIRIMVMSPTFAYWEDENGNRDSADKYMNSYGTLATYVIKESDTCYENSVSFIDNYYGTVNELNASDYLEDKSHLNLEGRKLVAKRFVECMNKYN